LFSSAADDSTRMRSTAASLALLSSCAALSLALPSLGTQPVAGGVAALRPRTAVERAGLPRTTSPLLSAAAVTAPEPQGASVTSSIISVAKNVVGSGVLTLAAGVAAFSGSPAALIPALSLLLFLGGVSGYSFSSIARVGSAVGASTYKDTWAKLFPKSTAILPAITVTFMTFCAGLSYSIIIGDSFASMSALAGLPAFLHVPNVWICLLSVIVLFPVCLLRDLSSLAIGSVIGTAGTLYTALFMTLRYFDGTYAAGGKWHALISAAQRPEFIAATAAKPVVNLSIFVLISMLATAFLAHYNAPRFYEELAPAKDGSKLGRFNLVCAGAFGLASLLMGLIMAMGFLTFGANSQGLILNNYATKDTMAFLARVGIGASIIFSYPLNFAGLRQGVLSIFGKEKAGDKPAVHVAATALIMLATSGLALVVKDLGLIAALGGAILGSALVYIYPALMFIANARKQMAVKRGAGEPTGALQIESAANWGLLVLGAFLAVVGCVMSLK